MQCAGKKKKKYLECSALDSVHCLSQFAMSIQSYFKPKGSLPDLEGLLSTRLPNARDALGNKAVEKATMDKSHGEKCGQNFMSVVALKY